MKTVSLFSLLLILASCGTKQSGDADMYEASEMSQLMREMVRFSKKAKANLEQGKPTPKVPEAIWELQTAEGTRDEHLEDPFQAMAVPYLSALRGIERGDSQAYFYSKSIDACKSCHGTYCGGPMAVINTLGLEQHN
ncbi:MAG: hypothetical protein JJ975_09610 [Bacteroidia bacterium]|nr:hypothetical protein [Bacteroidia bacterium]